MTNLVASQARILDGFTDFALIAVCSGGVDVAVAGRERRCHGLSGLVRRCLEDPQSEGAQPWSLS
jgi:hypothetical protein